MKTTTRSSHYQDKILEIPHNFLEYPMEDKVMKEDLYLIDLNQKAINYIIHKAKLILNKKQIDIINYLLDGYTQSETAKLMGYSKSNSIIASYLRGSVDWREKQAGHTKIYGGAAIKLKASLLSDTQFLKLLQQLYDAEYGNILRLVKSWFETEDDFIDWLDTDNAV